MEMNRFKMVGERRDCEQLTREYGAVKTKRSLRWDQADGIDFIIGGDLV